MKLDERAATIHKRTMVIDAHFDLLMDVEIQRQRGRKKVIESDFLPNFTLGSVDIIVASVFIDNDFLPEMSLRKALGQISSLLKEVEESKDKIMICLSNQDALKAKREGKVGFFLSLEGAEPIGCDLRLLQIFYKLGVRMIGLTWSRRNEVGEGSHFSPVREGKKGGITPFGIQLIEAAEDIGMVIDVSHLNDEGFWDVMEVTKKPFIASHSNVRAITNTMRNLDDEQIIAIATKNGVIGINAVNFIVSEDDERADIDGFIDHIDYIVNLVGINHVGFGLDLCDYFMKYVSQDDLMKMKRKPFDVVDSHKSFPWVTDRLLKRGYNETDIKKMLGNNFLRVFKETF